MREKRSEKLVFRHNDQNTALKGAPASDKLLERHVGLYLALIRAKHNCNKYWKTFSYLMKHERNSQRWFSASTRKADQSSVTHPCPSDRNPPVFSLVLKVGFG